MIDWHCHILPGIDDGSRSIEESVLMLELLREQGVSTAVATPHFYSDNNSVKEFLIKREKSYNALRERLNDDLPEILLGAEVCYYPGVSKLSGLRELCIQGTDILLLEMPVAKWTQYTVKEVLELACSGEFTVLIAHMDRYVKFRNDAFIKKMRENGVYMQMNASFFDNLLTRKKAFKALKSGVVHFIGSDCHNTGSRKSEIGAAFNYIRRKFGDDFIRKINEFGYSMIN